MFLLGCDVRREVPDMEVVATFGADLAILAQDPLNVATHARDHVSACDLYRDIPDLPGHQLVRLHQPVAQRCERHKNDIILILPIRRRPFTRQNADDLEREIGDPHPLANRLFVAEQFLRHPRADHGHLRGPRILAFRHVAANINWPFTQGQIRRMDPVNVCQPVSVRGNDRAAAPEMPRDRNDAIDLGGDVANILFCKWQLAVCADRPPTHTRGPWPQLQILAPRLAMRASISCLAPWLTAIMTITEATPIMMPSVVSAVRIGLLMIAVTAERNPSKSHLMSPP